MFDESIGADPGEITNYAEYAGQWQKSLAKPVVLLAEMGFFASLRMTSFVGLNERFARLRLQDGIFTS